MVQNDHKIFTAISRGVDWAAKHWFKMRNLLLFGWIVSNVGQWVLLRVFLSDMYWLMQGIRDVFACTLIVFLLAENYILRYPPKKNNYGSQHKEASYR